MTLRFIAGASCPSCNCADTIRARLEEGVVVFAQCVDCGWESDRPVESAPPAAGDGIARVRILDPEKD